MTLTALTDAFLGLFNYWVVIVLMMIGFYTVIAHDNLVKKVIGLNLFQTSVFIFYVSMGVITGSTAPLITEGDPIYAHPLPHVLILTAIVVGVATTALGLALVVRIHESYGSIEEDEILVADLEAYDREAAAEAWRTENARAREEKDSAPGREDERHGDTRG